MLGLSWVALARLVDIIISIECLRMLQLYSWTNQVVAGLLLINRLYFLCRCLSLQLAQHVSSVQRPSFRVETSHYLVNEPAGRPVSQATIDRSIANRLRTTLDSTGLNSLFFISPSYFASLWSISSKMRNSSIGHMLFWSLTRLHISERRRHFE